MKVNTLSADFKHFTNVKTINASVGAASWADLSGYIPSTGAWVLGIVGAGPNISIFLSSESGATPTLGGTIANISPTMYPVFCRTISAYNGGSSAQHITVLVGWN